MLSYTPVEKDFKILFLGLEGSGKTTIITKLKELLVYYKLLLILIHIHYSFFSQIKNKMSTQHPF